MRGAGGGEGEGENKGEEYKEEEEERGGHWGCVGERILEGGFRSWRRGGKRTFTITSEERERE